MSYAYQPQQGQQPPQGTQAFDLDDLLGGTTNNAAPPPPQGPPPPSEPAYQQPPQQQEQQWQHAQSNQQAPPPPPPGSPPGQQHQPQYQQQPQQQPQYQQQSDPADVFGVPQYQQQQQQQPQQHYAPPPQQPQPQQQSPPGGAYQYQQPQQPQQQQQPPQQQPQYQPPAAPAQQQAPPQQGHYGYQQQQQQQQQQQEPSGMQRQSTMDGMISAAPAAPQAGPAYTYAQQQPPQGQYGYPSQPQGQPAHAVPGYPPHHHAHATPDVQPVSSHSNYGPPQMGGAYGAQHTAATTTPPPSGYNEDADRQNLERIRQLREALEREQQQDTERRAATEQWTCRSCTYKNSNSVTRCEMCDEARAGYSTQQQQAAPRAPVQQQQQPSPPPQQQRQPLQAQSVTSGGPPWMCNMCQANNAGGRLCRVCNTPKPDAPEPQPSSHGGGGSAQQPLPPGVWACSNCTLHNPNALDKCQACEYNRPGLPSRSVAQAVGQPPSHHQSAPAQPSVWTCRACTYENKVASAKCEMCGDARPPGIQAPPVQATPVQATPAPSASSTATGAAPAITMNGRPLTAEQQAKLVEQQRQILQQIEARKSGAAVTPPAEPASRRTRDVDIDGSDDDEDDVQWQRDADATRCTKCRITFTMLKRRHHCRRCGFVFCNACSSHKVSLKPGGAPERVCLDCFNEKTSTSSDPPRRSSAATTASSSRARTVSPQASTSQHTAAVHTVPCDCAGAEQGFHRSGCPNNRSSAGGFSLAL